MEKYNYYPNSNSLQVFTCGLLDESIPSRDGINTDYLGKLGYTRVEYMEYLGGRCFDTGYLPNKNTVVEFTYSPVILDGNDYTLSEVLDISNFSDDLEFSTEPEEIKEGEIRKPLEKYRNNLKSGLQKTIKDDKSIVYTQTTTFTDYTGTDKSLVFFYNEDVSDKVGIRIYAIYIEESGVQVHNYIPVKNNATGETELFDFVDNKPMGGVKI